jgi:hypothetical protein
MLHFSSYTNGGDSSFNFEIVENWSQQTMHHSTINSSSSETNIRIHKWGKIMHMWPMLHFSSYTNGGDSSFNFEIVENWSQQTMHHSTINSSSSETNIRIHKWGSYSRV